MSRAYLRNARLRVGTQTNLNKEFVGFHMAFKLEKTLESNPNTGTITIYNLSPDSRARFEAKDAVASLEAGYGDSLQLIFMGTIARASSTVQGINIVTEIEIGDGEKAINQATLDKSYPPGAPVKDILSELGSAFQKIKEGGVTAMAQMVMDETKKMINGFTASGSVSDMLDTLTKSAGMEWSVQDGQVQILPKGKATQETMQVINTTSGLIGSPGRVKGKDKEGKDIAGITFTCLLNPGMKPGRLVKVESELLTGVYKLTKVTHEGDTRGGNWLTTCEGEVPK